MTKDIELVTKVTKAARPVEEGSLTSGLLPWFQAHMWVQLVTD